MSSQGQRLRAQASPQQPLSHACATREDRAPPKETRAVLSKLKREDQHGERQSAHHPAISRPKRARRGP